MAQRLTSDEFIEKAREIHGDKYDYSKVNYIDAKTKVIIICKTHGEFEQIANNHLRGLGCKKCYYAIIGNNVKLEFEEFINKSNKIHNNKYDYRLAEYINSKIKLKIICNKHGVFEQTPNSHMAGQGCPLCFESKGEIKIKDYLDANNIQYFRQKTFNGDFIGNRSNKFRFDFYLPEYNLCIEFDGEQHFKVVPFWGGECGLRKRIENDAMKNLLCESLNIKLLRITYKQFNKIEDIIKENLQLVKSN